MKKVTRVQAGLVLVLLASLILSACTAQPAAPADNGEGVQPAKEIVLYNWTDYMNPDILTEFEAEYGIKVIEDYFSSNEEMVAKLQGGATGYALIIPSDYAVSVLIEQGLLAELDKANVPNEVNLNERFKNPDVDPGNAHCMPYQWGTTGIAYLTDQVEPVTSWQAFFEVQPGDPQYGRMTMVDDARDGLAAALLYLGYDVNTMDEAQLEEAKQLLIQVKPALSGYDSDTFEDLLASGENLISHGWNGEFLGAQEENPNIEYVIPEEGGIVYMEEICIPVTASAEEKLAAEMFINYLLEPEIGAQLSEYIYYGTPNAAAQAFLSEEYRTNPIINPPDEVLARLHFLKPLGEFDLVYQRLWDEVKSAPVP